jgi:FkbM family methyltransferase
MAASRFNSQALSRELHVGMVTPGSTAGVGLAFSSRQYARKNRTSQIVRHLASKSERFLQGFYNQGFYDFHDNGEADVIEIVVSEQTEKSLIALDDGANRGEWAKAVLDHKADAIIYCFEILPSIAKTLREAFLSHPNVHVYEHGLSSLTQNVDVFWNHKWDTASSISPRLEDPLFVNSNVTTLTCKVDTGDAVLKRLAMPRIDFLKIDVEGHEIEVLSGFEKTLQTPELRPQVIQFEYGATWLPTRHNLWEAYRLLGPLGYITGRLYPDGVDFKPYSFEDDHFRMGNYIAVQAHDPLAERLAHF